MKIRFHPLFFAATALYLVVDGPLSYLLSFLAIAVHEFAHYAFARLVGAKGLSVTLMPYGAAMRAEGEIPHLGAVLAAGPLANLFLASILLSLSWIFPELYGYFKSFISANFLLAIANLLPAYPLDGGRLVRLLFPGEPMRFLTALFTLLTSLVCALFFLISKNLSLLFFSLFTGSYFFAFCLPKVNRISVDAPLYALVKPDEEGRFLSAWVKEGKRTFCKLSSVEVAKLCLTYPREMKVGEAIAREQRGYK